MNQIQQVLSEVSSRFDEKFPVHMNYGAGSKQYLDSIKSFNATLLNDLLIAVREEVKGLKEEGGEWNDGVYAVEDMLNKYIQ